jgi:hypothetical protein
MAKRSKPRVGEKVVLKALPAGFLTDLPRSDKTAISKMIGRRVRLVAYEADGRAELEFTDSKGHLHYLYVNARFIAPIPKKAIPKKKANR